MGTQLHANAIMPPEPRRYIHRGQDIEQTLKRYDRLYNHHISQKTLNHRTPSEVLKD